MKPLPPRVLAIVLATAERYRINPELLVSGSDRHTRAVAHARFEAMGEARALDPRPSLPTIGRWFSCDHTHVLYGLRHVARRQVQPAVEQVAA